jgi:2-oxoglutarate ferredoxin oxidoreductase subunit alpha
MHEVQVAPKSAPQAQRDGPPVVNDFTLVVATVNGTGSQTANLALMQAIFRMGVPVGGKNLFPSNIQGLPTWFRIRVNAAGFTGDSGRNDILVAMNPATMDEDLRQLPPGGVCFHSQEASIAEAREDVLYYAMPVNELLRAVNPPSHLRDYIANMVYVGVVAQMLGITQEEIRQALMAHFRGKREPVEANMAVVQQAAQWAQANLTKRDPYLVRPDDKTAGLMLIDGNTAAALGAIYGGLTFAAWYPITPASSIADAVHEYLPRLRRHPETGKATWAIIQAEDEISAIGMAIGAGWAGARSMTSTSGPGISLMAEFSGLAYFAEIPVVIWDVQRMGPSTGLPTRTSQGDLLFVRNLGHGDTAQVILLPGSMEECFEFGWRAFDLAERLQTPIYVLSDLDLGMNTWLAGPFEYPQQPMDRGKVLSAEDIQHLGDFARYRDVDGDGIPYRTLPGLDHPQGAWFARGTGHDEKAIYSERPEVWTRNMQRLRRKHETARQYMPGPVVSRDEEGSDVGIVAFGSTDLPVREARAVLAEKGMPTDYMRIRSVPFTQEVGDFICDHERIYVVEMNELGQMRQLLQVAYPEKASALCSLTHNDGMPLNADWVVAAFSAQEET